MTDVAHASRLTKVVLAAFLFVAVVGVTLRIYPSSKFNGVGYDEGLYRNYVVELIHTGVTNYPDLAENHVKRQAQLASAVLPPTRFLYIFCAYLWHEASGAEPLIALHRISTLFSILLLFAAGGFAYRLGGASIGLGVFALMSCAPTQIHMAQHALIDGFFAFWATLCVWFLWENLRRPGDWRWLASYTAALALMVLTKENAAFAYTGLLAVLALNRWLRFGSVTPRLLILTIAGPLIGVVVLVFLCGGITTFVETYRLLVSKASVLPYAIATGDGPWYRYLVDLLLVSPVIFLLGWGGIVTLRKTDRASIYLITFMAATYLVMCNVRYGMNLRYTNMWDMPMRYLAVVCLMNVTQSMSRNRSAAIAGSIAVLCFLDLRQYQIFFMEHDLYELVTGGLLRAVNMLK
jgi:4-amino-4-deoxy-L-arabinose transferase-like glycosyltransferase